jgi:thaumarchaeosortase
MSKKHNTKSFAGLNSSFKILVMLVLIAPILVAIIAYPESFTLSWNEGRGGFIFALVFIIFELLSNNSIDRKVTKKFYFVLGLSILSIGYFVAIESFGLRDLTEFSAYLSHVQLVDSWNWMWDYIVMGSFISSSLFILFGKKCYKITPATIIYLSGNAIILSLDAFFPYDTLGPLQMIVPVYLEIDESVIGFIDKYILDLGSGRTAIAEGNSLILSGLHGPFALRVFWPSAGVHSLIIYTLVMLAFLLKIDISVSKRLVYFIIGIIGTVSVNIIRIISLSLFPLLVTTNVSDWEEFHSVVGEVMFLPWLGIYLFTVMYIESKRQKIVVNDNKSHNTGRLRE